MSQEKAINAEQSAVGFPTKHFKLQVSTNQKQTSRFYPVSQEEQQEELLWLGREFRVDLGALQLVENRDPALAGQHNGDLVEWIVPIRTVWRGLAAYVTEFHCSTYVPDSLKPCPCQYKLCLFADTRGFQTYWTRM